MSLNGLAFEKGRVVARDIGGSDHEAGGICSEGFQGEGRGNEGPGLL